MAKKVDRKLRGRRNFKVNIESTYYDFFSALGGEIQTRHTKRRNPLLFRSDEAAKQVPIPNHPVAVVF